MTYTHTQHGPLARYLLLVAIGLGVLAICLLSSPPAAIILGAAAGVCAFVALSMGYLTISDQGDTLSIRYGPLPLFRTTLRYDFMKDVHPGRSTFIDGWGIHWVPGRGWTYNLWGRDCVEIQMRWSTIRVGTDDPEGLARFLQSKLKGA